MKKFTLLAIAALSLAIFTGCGYTANAPDGRTGISGRICAFGMCVEPAAMLQNSEELYNPVQGGSLAPVAIGANTAMAAGPACAAPAGAYLASGSTVATLATGPVVSYNSPLANVVSQPAPQPYYPPAPPQFTAPQPGPVLQLSK